MIKLFIAAAAVGAFVAATPAAANHVFHLNDPFPSRGACQAETSALSNDDDWLLDAFPQLFSSEGEVRSFLNRAFKCEPRGDEWFITDHRVEVINSDWFQRRQ
jgi:hypothetical protein